MIISLHIPKTAGSTFRRHLCALFEGRIVFDYNGPYEFIDPYPPTPAVRYHRLIHRIRVRRLGPGHPRPGDACIHGHLQVRKYLDTYPDAQLVTWLRDPVERVVSHYYHWKQRPDYGHSTCRRLIREDLSLVEFASLPEMQNLQHRYLDGIPLEAFWFVGIQEYYEDLIGQFYRQLGETPREIASANVNTRHKQGDRYPLDADVRAHILRMNEVDRLLYEAACDRNGAVIGVSTSGKT